MTLRILHLSDIHFSTKFGAEPIVHADVRERLVDDLRDELVPKVGPIDSVLIVGDIAFSGTTAEYNLASDWLEKVTSTAKCPKTAVLVVPGNHDADRKRLTPVARTTHRRLRTCGLAEATKELVDIASSEDGTFLTKLTDYHTFASQFRCQFESGRSPRWSRSFGLGHQATLNFWGMTSVQVCDEDDDYRAMFLGRHQFVFDTPQSTEHVVVSHHPWEWLKDQEEARGYLTQRAKVIIFGHEHVQSIHKITDIDGDEWLVIGSGAVTPENAAAPYIYRYNVIEFSAVQVESANYLRVCVFPRIWVDEKKRFGADTNRLAGRSSGTFDLKSTRFSLDAGNSRESPPPTETVMGSKPADMNFDRLVFYFWRYLSWQQRLDVLVRADVLPAGANKPLPQSVENLALERAKSESRLGILWDMTMKHVPADKREPNPYTQR